MPQSNLWRWRDNKYKVHIPILSFLLFFQLSIWRSLRPLLVFWLFRIFVSIVTFLLAGIAPDVAQVLSFIFVFLCYLDSIDPSGWMASSTTFMTLIFLGSLALRLISRRKIMGLSLIFVIIRNLIPVLLIGIVLVFFDRRPIVSRAPKVDLLSLGGWLEAGLYFYIDGLLYYFVLYVQVSFLIVQLGLDG